QEASQLVTTMETMNYTEPGLPPPPPADAPVAHNITTRQEASQLVTTMETMNYTEPGLPPPPPVDAPVAHNATTRHEASQLVTTMETMNYTEPGCIPSGKNGPFDFAPTTKYRDSDKLPQWIKERQCGGIADRLKSIPFFIAAGARYKRIFLIRWSRPTKLEEFLLPNEINWSVPDWLPDKVDNFKKHPQAKWISGAKVMFNGLQKYERIMVLEGMVQDFYGGSRYYKRLDIDMDDAQAYDEEKENQLGDSSGWYDYEIILRDLFFSIFQLAPPIAKLVQQHLDSANLVRGEFAAAQYRAFHHVADNKTKVTDATLQKSTRNALNCASQIQPGVPIFFASDSQVAVNTARFINDKHPDRHIVTFDGDQEALHLDKMNTWTSGNVSDFYSAFVDLLVMAEAKCISIGRGGYTRFANSLSIDPTCVIRHDSERRKTISICDWHSGNTTV
ncbi:unnamed protein product, partial [Pseudo-nitzschia multistriata]